MTNPNFIVKYAELRKHYMHLNSTQIHSLDNFSRDFFNKLEQAIAQCEANQNTQPINPK